MRWFHFSHLQRDRPAPPFRLPSSLGRPVASADYLGRHNLVLLFLPGLDRTEYQTALESFAARRQEYEEQAAQVLVIFSGPRAESVLKEGGDFPVPLLADAEGSVRRAYAALLPEPVGEEPMVFVLDRYRGPLAALSSPALDDPAVHREILQWLTFFEIQCPECGAPEWPEDL